MAAYTGLSAFKLTLTVVLLSTLPLYPLLAWQMKSKIAAGYGDFIIFYTGAEILKAGMGARLYDYDTQMEAQRTFKVGIRAGPLLFNHLPFELLIFLPLVYLSYPVAYLVWLTINLVLLGVTFRLIVPFIHRQHKLIFALLLLAFFPVFVALVQGQDSILSTALLAGSFASLKYKREHVAGALLALGLFKPQLVLPMMLVLLFKRCWAAVTGFVTVGILLGALSLWMVGRSGWAQFVTLLTEMNRQQYSIQPAMMPNLRGFFETVLAGRSGPLPTFLVLSASLALLIWLLSLWRDGYRTDERSFNLKFSCSVAVTVLTSYHLMLHDLTVLALPAILALDYVFSGAARTWATRMLFLCSLAPLCFPVTYAVLLSYEKLSWAFWMVLSLACALALDIRQQEAKGNAKD